MMKPWKKIKTDYMAELINRIFEYTDLVIDHYITIYTSNEYFHDNDTIRLQLMYSFIKHMKEDGYINPSYITKRGYDEVAIRTPFMDIGVKLLGDIGVDGPDLRANKTLLWDIINLRKGNITPIIYKVRFPIGRYDYNPYSSNYYSDDNTAVIE